MLNNVINWNDCVRQSNNKPDLAQELLDMLALELPQFKNDISQSHAQRNAKDLRDHVHKLHGACCYCGANTLKKILFDIENQMDYWTDAELAHHVDDLLTAIDQVQNVLATKQYKN